MHRQLMTVVAILGIVAAEGWAGARAGQWGKVDEAVKQGLPKTAIEHLDRIIPAALADKAFPEVIKAICTKIALEGNIQGNRPEAKTTRLQAEIDKVPGQMRPVLEAILGHWYWQYFQHNRWRFMQRTQTAEQPGPDIQTWDLARILAEIDRHFQAALADDKTLKAQSVSAYNGLLVKGTMPDAYRPTMYDFLVHEALEFYSAGEQGVIAAEETFVLEPDGPIFAPWPEFSLWEPKTPDVNSPTLRAIRLYQGLLAFHKDDRDKTALADADLGRLVFGHNKAADEGKADPYKASLKRFVETWSDWEVSARALYEWARIISDEGDLLQAHTLAQRGLKAFPRSVGADLCFNLIQEIESKSAQIETERVWNEPLPEIRVTYRNVTKIFFRAVPWDFKKYLQSGPWSPYDLHNVLSEQILARKPSLEWAADLPATADYRQHTEALAAPTGLKPGFYFLIASHNPSFRKTDNQVSTAQIWVSDMAVVVREYEAARGVIEGLVVRAETGDPIAKAQVQAWTQDQEGRFAPGLQTVTDDSGAFTVQHMNRQFILTVEHEGQGLASSARYAGIRPDQDREPLTRTVLFTDRSLYRPGQTVQYKGICIQHDQGKAEYQALAGQRVTVVLLDTNGKDVTEVEHRCNDFGAFSGSFIAPRDRGTGRMLIKVVYGPEGMSSFSVEEYKRPKFHVELGPPTEPAKLNAEVQVVAKASAYTGAAIGGAKVAWRVVREVRWPLWRRYCYWWPPQRMESQAIAHGQAVTEADGSFAFRFVARPDPAASEKDEPIFEFTVSVDVTDTTGETRSAQRTIRVGFTALQASIEAGQWQTVDKPVELQVRTQSLDGDGQAATGTVKVHALKQPDKVVRAGLAPAYQPWEWRSAPEPGPDPADPNSWELGDTVAQGPFQTDANGLAKVFFPLKAGVYRVMLDTRDPFGKPVHARRPIHVLDLKAKAFAVKVPNHLAAQRWSVGPGESFVALWGTGYDKGRAFVEIECAGKVLRRYWTGPDRTQEVIEQQVTEDMRGGFTLRVTYVRENRSYIGEQVVDVPWTNKQLAVKWERFRSKLTPGQKEVWTAVVTGPDSHRAVAEFLAGLYDASLDQYLGHEWIKEFNVFRHEEHGILSHFQNWNSQFQHILGTWSSKSRDVDIQYRAFPREIRGDLWGYGGRMGRFVALDAAAPSADPETTAGFIRDFSVETSGETAMVAKAAGMGGRTLLATPVPKPSPDLAQVSARKNLQETAFFFPHMVSDANGVVRMEFTMPEALTTWKFMGFAHDKVLRSGFLMDNAVTAKDIMVQPNAPRFVREGDCVEFTVKVSNQSSARQTGQVRLRFADARTLESRDAALGNAQQDQAFDVAGKESKTFSWRISVPDGCEFLTYKAVGATDRLSDGEEGVLPVLSRRVLVTESLPLPIRGAQTKAFEFTRLIESGKSDTLRHQSVTVQMVSQPAWYAVMALPYLMEYPYECSEQVFNRFYANTLARHVARADPKIRRVFDLWKAATPALDSPLDKNPELKAVALEETPWLSQAEAESKARRDVGILFDENRLDSESVATLSKLAQMQLDSGLWPWFPGCRGSEYITLYIVTGFGRLRHLGVSDLDIQPATKALEALDAWMDKQYRDVLAESRKDANKDHLNSTIALYLYGRSFFLEDRPVDKQHGEALDYWLGQAKEYWLQLNCRQSQAHLAIALKRFGVKDTPDAILRSIKERSVTSGEMGMSWRDTELSWWWYHAPIETQAMMIEAFDEVAGDAQAVEDCKVWLLKQKQTQAWRTTKATADAVYGLLLRGANLLSSDALVEVSLAGEPIRPEKVEAGTGFYEQRFMRTEIRPQMGLIQVRKTDAGVSWGSMHWQYLEDMAKVTSYEGTPLKLKKALFIKETTDKGQVLRPVQGPVAVGDELVVRIELRVDRTMEYVHMKDQRGSGTEPVDVLSRYKWQDGLGYYESTRDTATHFFMDRLPEGVYVFEYSTRVQLRGKYQTGIASIQCMYAPEFNSHSEGLELDVR